MGQNVQNEVSAELVKHPPLKPCPDANGDALTKEQQELITPELIGYADAVARRYQGCGLELDDLKQEARYGLCKAVLRYNGSAGASLKTYATFYIKKYVIMAIKSYGCIIRLKKEDRLTLKFDSLDMPLSRDGDTGADYLEDDEACSIAETIQEDTWDADLQKTCKEKVDRLMTVLTLKESDAITNIFGLVDYEHTIRQTSRLIGVQPGRVSQIVDKALNKMEIASHQPQINNIN